MWVTAMHMAYPTLHNPSKIMHFVYPSKFWKNLTKSFWQPIIRHQSPLRVTQSVIKRLPYVSKIRWSSLGFISLCFWLGILNKTEKFWYIVMSGANSFVDLSMFSLKLLSCPCGEHLLVKSLPLIWNLLHPSLWLATTGYSYLFSLYSLQGWPSMFKLRYNKRLSYDILHFK